MTVPWINGKRLSQIRGVVKALLDAEILKTLERELRLVGIIDRAARKSKEGKGQAGDGHGAPDARLRRGGRLSRFARQEWVRSGRARGRGKTSGYVG